MNDDRAIFTSGGGHQPQLALLLCHWNCFLFVAGRDFLNIRLDPDLQKVRYLSFGVIEFAVRYARARTHALHVSGRNAFDVAHAILVRKLTGKYIADDFHIAVAVLAEAGAWFDAVFINHPQITPLHVIGIVVTGK